MIVKHILSLFPGVSDIADVNPFANFVMPPKIKQITVTKSLSGSGVLKIAPGDSTLVSIRTILIRYTKNPSDTETVYVKRILTHPAAEEEDAEADRILVAMGGISGCIMSIPPKDDSARSVFVMKESPNCLYLQAPFIRTCMLVDVERNLMNGIILMNREMCAQELPTEAVVFDDRGESVSFEVDGYAFVPHGHILSWCLCVSDHWRRKRGIFAIEMDVTPADKTKAPFILYFAVAMQSFERLKQACIQNFLTGKLDKRPLDTVGLEVTGPAELSATFTYMEYPTDIDVSTIAPVLDSNFMPYSQVLQTEVEAIRAREAEEEEIKRRMEKMEISDDE